MKPATVEFARETIQLRNQIEGALIELGGRLKRIYNDEAWRGGWDSWNDYLDEIGFSKGYASKLMAVWGAFVEEGGVETSKLAHTSVSTLYTAIPLLQEKNATQVLTAISGLRRSDVKDMVHEHENGECHHEHTQWRRACNSCHKIIEYGEDI